jgi:hypothetical protein
MIHGRGSVDSRSEVKRSCQLQKRPACGHGGSHAHGTETGPSPCATSWAGQPLMGDRCSWKGLIRLSDSMVTPSLLGQDRGRACGLVGTHGIVGEVELPAEHITREAEAGAEPMMWGRRRHRLLEG